MTALNIKSLEELKNYRDLGKNSNNKVKTNLIKDEDKKEFSLLQFYSSPINMFYFLLENKLDDNTKFKFVKELREIKQKLSDNLDATKSAEIILENFFIPIILNIDTNLIQQAKSVANINPKQVQKLETLEEKLKKKNDARVKIKNSFFDLDNFVSIGNSFPVEYPEILLQLGNEDLNNLYKILFKDNFNTDLLIKFSKAKFLNIKGTSIPTYLKEGFKKLQKNISEK